GPGRATRWWPLGPRFRALSRGRRKRGSAESIPAPCEHMVVSFSTPQPASARGCKEFACPRTGCPYPMPDRPERPHICTGFELASAVLIGRWLVRCAFGKRLKSLVPTRGFEPRTY